MLRRSASGATASTPRWLALGRDDRHLARAAGVAVAVARDALAGDQLGRVENAHCGASRWPRADPLDDARAHRRGNQLRERGRSGKRHREWDNGQGAALERPRA
jgi:hypothetical protein